jgi:hypothetical protein
VLLGSAQRRPRYGGHVRGKDQKKARYPHRDWGRESAFINHFYFYLGDAEWGGALWKTNAYAPFPIWIWLSGHEWAKGQWEKAGIG